MSAALIIKVCCIISHFWNKSHANTSTIKIIRLTKKKKLYHHQNLLISLAFSQEPNRFTNQNVLKIQQTELQNPITIDLCSNSNASQTLYQTFQFCPTGKRKPFQFLPSSLASIENGKEFCKVIVTFRGRANRPNNWLEFSHVGII